MIVVFGDSFARIFTLFKSEKVQVYAFKGATLKGLTRGSSENRGTIERILKKNRAIKYAFFCFGQVDINLSFYYDIVKSKGNIPDGASQLNDHIKQYIDWINELQGNFYRAIILPYPSPLDANRTALSLIHYNSINKEQLEEYKASIEFCASDLNRKIRYFECIYTIQEYTKKNNVHRNIIIFNLIDHILNDNLQIRECFIDISKHNMHIRWEPLIPYIVQECTRLNIPLTNDDVVNNILSIEAEYLQYKTEWLQINNEYWMQ